MTSDAIKAAADRAEARAKGEPLPDNPPRELDRRLAAYAAGEDDPEAGLAERDPATMTETEKMLALVTGPSGRAITKYGPAPNYPATEEEEQQLLDSIVFFASQGHSLYAICFKIGVPYQSIVNWARQPFGAKLKSCLESCVDIARGALESMAAEKIESKDLNVPLYKFMMQARYPDAYRSQSENGLQVRLDATEKATSDFELKRRLASILDRREAVTKGEIIDVAYQIKEAAKGDEE